MKRMQYMEIEQMYFDVKELTARESANRLDAYDPRYDHVDIYAAYQKPSAAKVSVWNEWVQWAADVNTFDGTYEVRDLRIGSANCFVFTVLATIREFDVDEIGNLIQVATYLMVATKYRNYLYKLASDEDESGDDIDLCW